MSDPGLPDELIPAEEPSYERLRSATAQLRAASPPGAVEIADRVLRRTLAAPRRSELVRSWSDPALQVSTLAIASTIRHEVDGAVPGAAVQRVLIDVSRDAWMEALTIVVLVRFGMPIPDTADRVRAIARTSLIRLLGESTYEIAVEHVHVSDVTVGDPHLVDPADE